MREEVSLAALLDVSKSVSVMARIAGCNSEDGWFAALTG